MMMRGGLAGAGSSANMMLMPAMPSCGIIIGCTSAPGTRLGHISHLSGEMTPGVIAHLFRGFHEYI